MLPVMAYLAQWLYITAYLFVIQIAIRYVVQVDGSSFSTNIAFFRICEMSIPKLMPMRSIKIYLIPFPIIPLKLHTSIIIVSIYFDNLYG